MELDKIRNLSDAELKTEEAKAGEQLFRMRFFRRASVPQTNEGTKKLRELKLDIARIKDDRGERELGQVACSVVEAAPQKQRRKRRED